jgi:hypothetical protein
MSGAAEVSARPHVRVGALADSQGLKLVNEVKGRII